MKAIEVVGEKLVWREAESPDVGAGQIRIENHATAVNRADLVQRAGAYPPPPGASLIMGLECAGVISEVGEGVTRFKVGDAVCALLSGGGYAEEVVVAAGQALPIPKNLSLVQAAAIPEVFATAYLNLYMEANLQPGEKVLLHAGASGVGTAAIQLAKAFHNPSFVTVGSDDKVAECLALGATAGCNRHTESFTEQTPQWTDNNGFDVILDPVGGGYLVDNIASLALEGRLVLIGLMSGAQGELNLGLTLMKRLRIIGSTLRARSIAAKSAVMDQLLARVWPLLEAETITPVIDTILPVEEADAAQKLMAGNTTVGKVILQIKTS